MSLEKKCRITIDTDFNTGSFRGAYFGLVQIALAGLAKQIAGPFWLSFGQIDARSTLSAAFIAEDVV